jgi:hypothetical protein
VESFPAAFFNFYKSCLGGINRNLLSNVNSTKGKTLRWKEFVEHD